MKIFGYQIVKDKSKEAISAFSFNTGRKIEELINSKSNYIEESNKVLQAKILNWYVKTKDKEFAEYFQIETETKGKL